MSNMAEVVKAFEIIEIYNRNINISLLHCTSLYPAPSETLNLNAMLGIQTIVLETMLLLLP